MATRGPMAITHPSIFLTFLFSTFLLFHPEKAYVYGGNTTDSHHEVGISSLLPATVCSTTSYTKGLDKRSLLKIVHRHGPCLRSRLGRTRKKKTPDQILKQILLQDQIRVDSLRSILSNDSSGIKAQNSVAQLPVQSGINLGSGNYIVTVGFGTPKSDLSLIFDTGSSFTWIQCEPCARYCHPQQDTIFDPSKSTTYSNISCNSLQCSQLRSATSVTPGCAASTSTCIYGIKYGDQSYSVGFFGREKLTLTRYDVFPNFLFGCGQNNQGLFGRTAGLIGLGRNNLSLVSQTTEKYGGIFSYCLPSKSSSTGYLTFGNKGSSSSTQYTPLLTDSRGPSFYFLDLIAMSVGETKLPISASVFTSSGTIIDSGTVITRLPPSAYAALRSAFKKSMSSYPSTQPLSILDTCYNFTGYDRVTIPKIAFFFKRNVKVDIDISGILIAGSESQVCLAFAGNSDAGDVAILGNTQQKNLEVIYDLTKGRMGFSPKSCN